MVQKDYKNRISKARERAYNGILNGANEIHRQIEQLLKGQTTSPDFSKKLKDFDFLNKFISELFKNREHAVSVIAKLYQDGDIDILDEPFNSALAENDALVSEFFLKTYLMEEHTAFETEESDFNSWLNFMAEKSIQDGHEIRFKTFWSRIPSEECWCTVMRVLFRNYDSDKALDIIIKIMLGISGTPRELLRSALSTMLEEGVIESKTSIIVALAKNHTQGDDAILNLEHFARNLENENEKLKGKKEQLEYNASREPSRIYGELSKPIENLEILASNIATKTSPISPELVALNLKKYLQDFREGLEVLGIAPLEDYKSWQRKSPIEYRADRHSISIPTPPQMVYLRTLGFVYHDAEGVKKKVPAIVGRLQEMETAQSELKAAEQKVTQPKKHYKSSEKATTDSEEKRKNSNAKKGSRKK